MKIGKSVFFYTKNGRIDFTLEKKSNIHRSNHSLHSLIMLLIGNCRTVNLKIITFYFMLSRGDKFKDVCAFVIAATSEQRIFISVDSIHDIYGQFRES